MNRDGDWSRGTPQSGYPQHGYQAQAGAPQAAPTEASRIEALLHSVIDRLEDNESRYNTALGSLEGRLNELSERASVTAASAAAAGAPDAYARVGSQAADLARQVRDAGDTHRAQHNDDRFRAVEDRISEFAARMQQGGMAPQPAETAYQQQGGVAPQPAEAPYHQQPPAPAQPSYSFGQQFADAAAGFEQSLASDQPAAELEAINARIDDLVHRFDAMSLQRNDTSAMQGVEHQLNNLAAQFDQAREHYARVDSIESNLVRLMELTREADSRADSRAEAAASRAEAAAVMAAHETARHMGSGNDDISGRLDTVQRELQALTSLTGRIVGGDIPAAAPRAADAEYAPHAQYAAPQTHDAEYVPHTRYAPPEPPTQPAAMPPAQPAPIPVQSPDVPYDLDVERSLVGASIPDYQQPPPTGAGPMQGSQSLFADDGDFLASARRAAAAAASQAPHRPRKKSLFSGFRRRGSTDELSPAKAAKPRSLFITATLFLMVASAALIYGRLQDNSGIPAPGGATRTQPSPGDGAPAKSNSSSLTPTMPHFADGKDESKLPTGSLGQQPAGRKRAPLAIEQLPSAPASQQTNDRGSAPAAKLASAPLGFHVDPGIPGIAVRITDTDEPAAQAPVPAQAPAQARPIPSTPETVRFQRASIPQADVTGIPQAAAPRAVSRTPAAPMPPAAIGPQSLRMAAAQGDGAAQFEIATRYAKGSGVTRDFKTASEWFARAAAQSLAPAQYRLAALYERGRGVTRDPAMAKVWYERAAEAGNIKAMHNLAVIYSGGGEHRADNAAAAKWFTEAARHGLADSQFNLGILYESGLGVQKDALEAYQWFALAAAQGDKDAARRKERTGLQLRPDQVRIANRAIAQWRAKPGNAEANEVHAPRGGWRAVAGDARDGASSADADPLVLRVQSLLNKLGYDAGVPDGLAGPQTRAAIRRFQNRNGMDTDGQATADLVARLKALSS